MFRTLELQIWGVLNQKISFTYAEVASKFQFIDVHAVLTNGSKNATRLDHGSYGDGFKAFPMISSQYLLHSWTVCL